MEPEQIAEAVRDALHGPNVREVKMFGGVGFMLNGNMVVGASKRGLLARVGKEAQAEALSRPGARVMEMRGRVMEGYVFVDPEALTRASVATWLKLARAFVERLPAKADPPAKPATKRKKR